ncbi:MAG: MCE family protein [Spirochaetales bacterium]|nr:MCE family protein [Spirochaetales bacterium]
MKLRYRFANQVVGVFVILAVALTVALIVLMGSNQRWFKKNFYYHSYFTTASDIAPGMPITFRGFTIGKVTAITLQEDNNVDVEFYIQEEFIDKANEDSLIQLVTSPLGGGQIIFHQGRMATDPPPEGAVIPTYDSKQGLRLREENRVIVLRSTDAIAQALDQIDPILSNVDLVLSNLAVLTDDLNATLRGEASGPVAGILAGAEGAVAELEQTVVRVNQVLDDTTEQINSLLGEVEGIASNLGETTAALRDPTGLVPMLLDPKGSLATLLDDDNVLFDQIVGIIADLELSIGSLQESIADVENFTEYLNTTQPQLTGILEEGRQTLDASQDVIESLRNNPLLRGGIPEAQEQPSTFESIRDEAF